MKTQNEAILELLRQQGEAGVTPALALSEVSCMRLAARIDEIRARHLRADEEIVNVGWRTPTGRHVARYVLRQREPVELSIWDEVLALVRAEVAAESPWCGTCNPKATS